MSDQTDLTRVEARLLEVVAGQDAADVASLLDCKSYDEIPFEIDQEDLLDGLSPAMRNRLLIRAAARTLTAMLHDFEERYPIESRSIYPMVVVTDWQQLVGGRLVDVAGGDAPLTIALWCGNFANPVLGSFRLEAPSQPSDQLAFVAHCLGELASGYLLAEDVHERFGESSVERVYIKVRAVPAPWERLG